MATAGVDGRLGAEFRQAAKALGLVRACAVLGEMLCGDGYPAAGRVLAGLADQLRQERDIGGGRDVPYVRLDCLGELDSGGPGGPDFAILRREVESLGEADAVSVIGHMLAGEGGAAERFGRTLRDLSAAYRRGDCCEAVDPYDRPRAGEPDPELTRLMISESGPYSGLVRVARREGLADTLEVVGLLLAAEGAAGGLADAAEVLRVLSEAIRRHGGRFRVSLALEVPSPEAEGGPGEDDDAVIAGPVAS